MNIQYTTVALSFLLISACTPTKPSSEFSAEEFSNVSADTEVTVIESHQRGIFDAQITTNLSTDTHNILIGDGDQLLTRLDGEETDMRLVDSRAKFDLETPSTYFHRFKGIRSGSTLTVALRRNGVDYNESNIELPLPIAISAPAANEWFGRDDSISMAWAADDTTERVSVSFSAWCETPDNSEVSDIRFSHTVATADTGSLTITIEDLYNAAFTSQPAAPDGTICPTRIGIKRKKSERSDFGSGSITATQSDEVKVTILF